MRKLDSILNCLLSMAIVALGLHGPPSIAQEKEIEWAPFNGSATAQGPVYVLKGTNGGKIAMDRKHVRLVKGRPEVKIGANALLLDAPQGMNPASSVQTIAQNAPAGHLPANSAVTTLGICHKQDDCSSGCASCIGLVRVCCGGGGTRGVCFGVYGCP
jgi:hypothetical protein